MAIKSKYLLVDETGLDKPKVDETGLDKPKVDETAVDEIAVDEPDQNRLW